MKLRISLLLLVALFFGLWLAGPVAPTAHADTGRIVIYRVPPIYHWPPLPPPRPPIYNWNHTQAQNQSQIQSGNTNVNSPTSNVNSNNQLINQNLGTQISINGNMMPTPTQFLAEGKSFSFNEPRQNGVIAWNGKEQILILSTDENSNVEGGGATLSVLPLPGKPISVLPASTKAFDDATAMIKKKLSMVAKGTMLLEAKIGTHNIFIWKLDSPDDFADQVRAYIKEKYDGKADALVTEDAEKVIKQYFEQGFRYFAFDLAFMPEKQETKVAIAYRFESPYVYYPLVISRIGGEGKTRVTLAVFTPGLLRHFKGLRHEKVQVFGDKSVDLTATDLEPIDPEMAKLMGTETFKGRIFEISGQINAFEGDLMAW
ncbi:MAG: hypothetical protein GX621_10030 [Pirellulaceae bacterium]|nr:hypothetical protein [Pirellulaceae bacterium]